MGENHLSQESLLIVEPCHHPVKVMRRSLFNFSQESDAGCLNSHHQALCQWYKKPSPQAVNNTVRICTKCHLRKSPEHLAGNPELMRKLEDWKARKQQVLRRDEENQKLKAESRALKRYSKILTIFE